MHPCEKIDWIYQKGVIRRNTIVTIKRENKIYNDLKQYYTESKIVSNANPTDN
jgi:hypothetical protein